ncbi:venom serine protease-like [Culicoides brevitarsis]|uniref:venom serine protease-like n=1 Tax=Culicoides brevitarsis TaxID=469753 RepID=UPI00307C4A08
MKSAIFVLFIIFPSIFALWEGCDYYQTLKLGEQYTISSPNYPNFYGKNPFSCRWTAKAPTGYIVAFSCYIELPQSSNCNRDRLFLSRTGDQTLQQSEAHCGKKWYEWDSFDEDAVLALYVPYTTTGGRFQCNLSAVKKTCSCGIRNNGRKKNPYIVGGEPTGVNEFPSMAVLVDLTSRSQYCGGLIITNRFAVTAVHCIENRNPSQSGLLVGDHDYTTGSDTPYSALYNVNAFIPHEKYSQATKENDIALVQTRDSMTFNYGVSPVCLPFRYQWSNFTNVQVEFVGYGTKEFGGPYSKVPLKTTVRVLSNENCANRYNGAEKIFNSQVCAFAGGKDACQGDSGGPMLYTDPKGNVYDLGVISYGKGCASNMPSVNTRITSYLNWILDKTGDDYDYCYM